jgi:hypothetical protein
MNLTTLELILIIYIAISIVFTAATYLIGFKDNWFKYTMYTLMLFLVPGIAIGVIIESILKKIENKKLKEKSNVGGE